MSKARTQFVCQSCSYITQKWMGRCPECQQWNTFTEETLEPAGKYDLPGESRGAAEVALLSSVRDADIPRIALSFEELNRVLGGGLTRGSVVLLAGDPGVGKSTLLLQVAGEQAKVSKRACLYVTGEESPRQIRLRAERLGLANRDVALLATTNVTDVLRQMESMNPEIVVIDSVQTLYSAELTSIPGSLSQVRDVANRIVRAAKSLEVTVFLVGHVTKEGGIAGPMSLEHLVDTVLLFEGERGHSYRILRAVKNRFGPTDEIGVFEMAGEGLKDVSNPSELFLRSRPKNETGTVVFPALEGTRPLLVEVQALATRSAYGMPIRACVGFDKNRLTMLLAILEKRGDLDFSQQDVYVNVVGGIRLSEPAADLAVVSAIVSSTRGRPFPPQAVAFGEVGLAGEVRAVSRADQRLREAAKLGFKGAFVPAQDIGGPAGVELRPIPSLRVLAKEI